MIFPTGVKPTPSTSSRAGGQRILYDVLPMEGLAATGNGTPTRAELSWKLILALGIGGGTAMVPLLVLLGGLSQRESHATSLAAMILIAAAALVVYGGAGRVDVLSAVALLLGSLVGARQGAHLLSKAPERTLKA